MNRIWIQGKFKKRLNLCSDQFHQNLNQKNQISTNEQAKRNDSEPKNAQIDVSSLCY
jgi:hypothetical protein